jgi:hypothetical protein
VSLTPGHAVIVGIGNTDFARAHGGACIKAQIVAAEPNYRRLGDSLCFVPVKWACDTSLGTMLDSTGLTNCGATAIGPNLANVSPLSVLRSIQQAQEP